MKVSVIATVLNEGPAIRRLLDSLADQSRPPDEVVIVDGGSSDDTLSILRDWAAAGRLPLRILEQPGANISQGRNAAIAAASGELIVSTDAGVRLEPDWLAQLIAPFGQPRGAAPTAHGGAGPTAGQPRGAAPTDRRGAAPTVGEQPVSVVAGWFVADPHTLFETAMGATVLPALRDVRPASFLPSSRSVAFRQEAWQAVGGYPEWLDYCEDLVFDLRLRALFGPFPFAPQAVVHFRPRGSLRAFFRQYYRYARGDGKADLWRKRHAIRYLTYLLLAPILLVLALFHSPWWWLALAAGGAAYTATPYRRLWPALAGYRPLERLKALLWVPVIRVVGDVAKMLGYPVGLAWRWRNRRRPEVHWRLG
jgi:glycosyltransferase involved in cell wall biosynthesis